MSRYDVIVIGAGHNGLAVAAYLARAGRKVLVLEQRGFVGGIAAAEEFHPGYRSAGLLHDTTGVRPRVVADLDLVHHGLVLRAGRPDVLALGREGRSLWVRGGGDGTGAQEIARSSPRDAGRLGEYRAFLDRLRPVLRGFVDEPPLDLVHPETLSPWDGLRRALRLRGLGRRWMMELLRLPSMCVADFLDEWFEDDLLKAALALPAVAGAFAGPRSPGTCLNLLLWEGAAGRDVVGGGPALVAALEKAARHHGVEIRTGAAVERILVEGGAAVGVVLAGAGTGRAGARRGVDAGADGELRGRAGAGAGGGSTDVETRVRAAAGAAGEEIRAGVVVATCDPKRALLGLVPPGVLPDRLVRDLSGFRMRGATAQVLLALGAPPRFAGQPEGAVEFARIGSGMLAIERAFDAVKYRSISDEPALDVYVPTVARPDHAPPGHAVISVLVHYVPYDLDGEWDDAARERVGDRVMAILERHVPGLSGSLVAGLVLGPRDIEERYGLTGGHVHHGEHALDQLLVRPAPQCVRYATPLAGLYLCGGGTHPGGGLTCAPAPLATAVTQHNGVRP